MTDHFEHLSDNQRRSADAKKRDIIKTLYLYTADDTYISARACLQNRLASDFIWNAIHALEKYMKCALLLNDKKIKDIRHDIEKGYRRLKRLAPELLPEDLPKPDALDLPLWRNETPESFLARLMSSGGTDGRYNIFGFNHHRDDVFKLDIMVFRIRRLTVELETAPSRNRPELTNRVGLRSNPGYLGMRPGAPLDKLRQRRMWDTPRARTAFDLNLPFAPDEFEHDSLPAGFAGSNSVLIRRLADDLNSEDPDRQAIGAAVRAWFLKTNQVPKSLHRELAELGPPYATPKPHFAYRPILAVAGMFESLSKWFKQCASALE
jgi:hypothetical protein